MTFDNVRVPITNRLGDEGQGFPIAMQGINGTRVNLSACSVGGAQWALDETINYVQTRTQFGKKISAFQNTQFKLAQMAGELFAAKQTVRQAANVMDIDPSKAGPAAATAKLIATEKSHRIIDQCLQMFGGYGYTYDYPIQQLLRDNRVHSIIGGTNEMMRLIVARKLLGRD